MNIAVILAGGTGSRLGEEIPKQYLKVNNKTVIGYCMERVFKHPLVDVVQIVADQSWRKLIKQELEVVTVAEKFKGFSEPGETRQLSILNALEDISEYARDEDVVMIHDAARPLVSDKTIEDCFEQIKGHDGVMPVLPMKDTVYLSKNGKAVYSLLDRQQVFAGQAPESYVLGKYLAANKILLPEKIKAINGSTEPAIMAGLDICMVDGNEENFKITTQKDLERFAEVIANENKRY